MPSNISASPTFRAGAAQAAGYSTGQARGGGKHWSQTSNALRKAISTSQINNPIAWEKATGTNDAGKQLSMVLNLSETPNNLSLTVTHKAKIETEIMRLRDYERTFKGNHPMRSQLIAQANELERRKNDTEIITVPKDPPPEIATPEAVTLTGISEGATVTFLNPTTSALATQPLMVEKPSGAGDYVQETYNQAVEKYGKETADKLATQTYLTRGELKAQYPQLTTDRTPQPTPTPLPAPSSFTAQKPSKPPTYAVSTPPKSGFSSLPIISIIIIAVIVGIFLLRRRA